jgi:hypothetical protein
MNRRAFLLAGATTVIGATVAGNWWADQQVASFATAPMLARLQQFQGQVLRSSGQWSPFQIFSHLAQSIEFSLTGYPATKPVWFQHSVGRAAFGVFSVAGAMHHSLSEPIPGAPALTDGTEADAALRRLVLALQTFEQHEGSLAPHFAYGELNKAQYRAAHLMHIDNHLSELQG